MYVCMVLHISIPAHGAGSPWCRGPWCPGVHGARGSMVPGAHEDGSYNKIFSKFPRSGDITNMAV